MAAPLAKSNFPADKAVGKTAAQTGCDWTVNDRSTAETVAAAPQFTGKTKQGFSPYPAYSSSPRDNPGKATGLPARRRAGRKDITNIIRYSV